jgi:hypothetical protein
MSERKQANGKTSVTINRKIAAENEMSKQKGKDNTRQKH